MDRPLSDASCRRVLLLATNHVGNNIFCTPAARYLRRSHPNSKFDVVCTSRRGADAFKGNPDVSHVHLAFTKRGVRRIARGYDFIIGMYRPMATRCLRGVSIPHAIIDPDRSLHRADQRLEFVRSLSGAPIIDEDRRYMIQPDATDDLFIRTTLGPPAADEYRIGLHLGCGRTGVHGWKFWYAGRDQDARLWPLDHYIELATQLQRLQPRVRFVITGSANERFLARRFLASVPGTISLVGQTTIRSVAALMSYLRLFITQDTGILHVASATAVPIIALFGPSEVTEAGPYPRRLQHTIIKRPTMADITPAEVCAAANEVIAGHLNAQN